MPFIHRVRPRTRKPKTFSKFNGYGWAWVHNTSKYVYNNSAIGGRVAYPGSNAPAFKADDNFVSNYLKFTAASSEYFDLGASPIAATSSFTVLQLIRTTTNLEFPLSCRSSLSNDGYEFVMPSEASGKVKFRVSTSSSNQETAASHLVNDGKWHLLAGIVNYEAGTFSLIVDKHHIETKALSGSSITPTQNLYIGRRNTSYWDGDSAFVILLPRALSVGETVSYGRNPFRGLTKIKQNHYVGSGIGIGGSSNLTTKLVWWGEA